MGYRNCRQNGVKRKGTRFWEKKNETKISTSFGSTCNLYMYCVRITACGGMSHVYMCACVLICRRVCARLYLYVTKSMRVV